MRINRTLVDCPVCEGVAEKKCICCMHLGERDVCKNCVDSSLFDVEMDVCPVCGNQWRKPEAVEMKQIWFAGHVDEEGLIHIDGELEQDALVYMRQLERDREALIAALKQTNEDCAFCKHAVLNNAHCEAAGGLCENCTEKETCKCTSCTRNSNWEWRGVCDENYGGDTHED